MSDKELDRWGIAGAIMTAVGGAITLFVASKKGGNNSSNSSNQESK